MPERRWARQPLNLMQIVLVAMVWLADPAGAVEGPMSSPIPAFETLPVFGVSSAAPTTSGQAARWLVNRGRAGVHDPGDLAVVTRYLTYDALNRNIAYLLKLAGPLRLQAWREQQSELREVLGERYDSTIDSAFAHAQALAREIHFSVSLVKLLARGAYNGTLADDAGDAREVESRLAKISTQLEASYPDSRGELPPVLVAFTASLYQPNPDGVPVSCRNPLPDRLRAQVLGSLD